MNVRTFAVSILATLLAVLSLATAAGAECAWVLWERRLQPTAGSYPKEEWLLSAAEKGKSDCDKRSDELVRTYLNFKSDMFRYERLGDTKTLRMYMANQEMYTTSLFCLPDTVDPRGPKGGAR